MDNQPQHTGSRHPIPPTPFAQSKSGLIYLLDASCQADISSDMITYDSDDEVAKNRSGVIPFGGLRNKKGHPIYSREDIREQYCITSKELEWLESINRSSAHASKLFGCLSTSHLPDHSPCNKDSFLSCVQRRKTASTGHQLNQVSQVHKDKRLGFDHLKSNSVDDEDSSDGGFKSRRPQQPRLTSQPIHPNAKTYTTGYGIDPLIRGDGIRIAPNNIIYQQQMMMVNRGNNNIQQHPHQFPFQSQNYFQMRNMNFDAQRNIPIHYYTATSHSVEELNDVGWIRDNLYRQTKSITQNTLNYQAAEDDDDEQNQAKKRVTFAGNKSLVQPLTRSITVGGINLQAAPGVGPTTITTTSSSAGAIGERLINGQPVFGQMININNIDNKFDYDSAVIIDDNIGMVKTTRSSSHYGYFPVYRQMKRAVMKTQATQTDIDDSLTTATTTTRSSLSSRGSSRRSIPAYLTLSPRAVGTQTSKRHLQFKHSNSLGDYEEDIIKTGLTSDEDESSDDLMRVCLTKEEKSILTNKKSSLQHNIIHIDDDDDSEFMFRKNIVKQKRSFDKNFLSPDVEIDMMMMLKSISDSKIASGTSEFKINDDFESKDEKMFKNQIENEAVKREIELKRKDLRDLKDEQLPTSKSSSDSSNQAIASGSGGTDTDLVSSTTTDLESSLHSQHSKDDSPTIVSELNYDLIIPPPRFSNDQDDQELTNDLLIDQSDITKRPLIIDPTKTVAPPLSETLTSPESDDNEIVAVIDQATINQRVKEFQSPSTSSSGPYVDVEEKMSGTSGSSSVYVTATEHSPKVSVSPKNKESSSFETASSGGFSSPPSTESKDQVRKLSSGSSKDSEPTSSDEQNAQTKIKHKMTLSLTLSKKEYKKPKDDNDESSGEGTPTLKKEKSFSPGSESSTHYSTEHNIEDFDSEGIADVDVTPSLDICSSDTSTAVEQITVVENVKPIPPPKPKIPPKPSFLLGDQRMQISEKLSSANIKDRNINLDQAEQDKMRKQESEVKREEKQPEERKQPEEQKQQEKGKQQEQSSEIIEKHIEREVIEEKGIIESEKLKNQEMKTQDESTEIKADVESVSTSHFGDKQDEKASDEDDFVDELSGGEFVCRRTMSGELSTVSEVSEEMSVNGKSHKSDEGSNGDKILVEIKNETENGFIINDENGRGNSPSYAESTTSGSFMIDGNMTEPEISIADSLGGKMMEKSGSYPCLASHEVSITIKDEETVISTDYEKTSLDVISEDVSSNQEPCDKTRSHEEYMRLEESEDKSEDKVEDLHPQVHEVVVMLGESSQATDRDLEHSEFSSLQQELDQDSGSREDTVNNERSSSQKQEEMIIDEGEKSQQSSASSGKSRSKRKERKSGARTEESLTAPLCQHSVFTTEEWQAIVSRRARSLSRSPDKLFAQITPPQEVHSHQCVHHVHQHQPVAPCNLCAGDSAVHRNVPLFIPRSQMPLLYKKSATFDDVYLHGADDDEDIGVHSDVYMSSLWAYIGQKDELEVWGHKSNKLTISSTSKSNGEKLEQQPSVDNSSSSSSKSNLARTDSNESTYSERDFRRQYESVTHRMIHRKASIEMYKRIMSKSFDIDKIVTIQRNIQGEFGFRIHGSRPVVVSAIEKETPAEACGLDVGDIVVNMNGQSVLDLSHSEVVKLAHNGDEKLVLHLISTRSSFRKDLTSPTAIGSSSNQRDIVMNGYLTRLCPFVSGSVNINKDEPSTSTAASSSSTVPTAEKLLCHKNRWFMLKSDYCLYWYKSTRQMDPLGVICLKGYSAKLAPELSPEEPFSFKLIKYGTKQRYFAAKDNDTANQWVDAINQIASKITKADPYIDLVMQNVHLNALHFDSCDCSGYLGKFNQRRKVWRHRYFVLKDACLYFYHNVNTPSALGVFFLQGYRVHSCLMLAKKHTFEAIPPDSKFKHLWLMAESDVDKKRWIAALQYSIDRWIKCN